MYTKENKNLYESVSKSGSLFREYIIEAQNPIQKILNKENVAMIITGLNIRHCALFAVIPNTIWD